MAERSIFHGVEVVIIPAAEYAELLDCRRMLAEANATRMLLARPARSPIERDPEVAIFFAGRLGLAPMIKLLAECRSKFGPARTPSHSALHRYWQRLRRPSPPPG